jgi:hypothetical protein
MAANGPLFYQWLLNGNVLTNGANGFSGTLFSGAATNTLAISNYPAALAGQTLMVSVTNTSVNTPATSSVMLPALFPTPALWTVNFAGSNVTAYAPYNGGTFLDLGYTGYGAIGQGTIWNNINVGGASPYTNVSSLNDLGTMTNTGVNMAVVNTGNGCGPNPQNNYLLDLYISLPAASTPNGLVITGLQPGYYNVFIYAQLGTWGNRGSLFTYNGVFQTTALGALNSPIGTQGGATYPNEDLSYGLGTNYVIFTNIFCTNGTISFTTDVDNSQPPFNGLQVQLISPYQDLAVTQTGTNAAISFAGGTLMSGSSVAGPFSAVTTGVTVDAGSISHYTVPSPGAGKAVFYIMQLGTVPGVPIQ